ncbi:MAG TPA: recombination regulator RecX [Burkholderiaceae bacterium]|nr:recombination regulator RecX [Burkholderiaceae bacterium]
MKYAVAQLARREHSRAELRGKLLRRLGSEVGRAEAAAQAERILDELQAKGLLSEARFAAALTRAKATRFGAARIRLEMREHDLPDEIVRPAIAQLQATEEERARELWKRRFGRAPADAAERARQMRFLAQRGFSAAVVLRIVRSASAEA